ncbi:MAG: hypothetical protein QE271_03715 [Bacteriovoracaceae bacterium]|nr:hypothetical protein [Bacteriovoracaceae bacterium]
MESIINIKSKTQILVGILFFSIICGCDVEDQTSQDLGITNNLNSIGGEVIVNPSEKLNAEEVSKIIDFCKIVQKQNILRFNSQASYNFKFKKCATDDNVPVTIKYDLTLSQLPKGKTFWVQKTGDSINEFFRENLSITSGPLGRLCPDLLRGATKDASRYLVENESTYTGIYIGQGSSKCGDGVGSQEYCLIIDNLKSLGGQTHQISSRTMSSFVTDALSDKYNGLQYTRNYLSLASNCKLNETLYQVDTQIILE